jgi:hypothetical protein
MCILKDSNPLLGNCYCNYISEMVDDRATFLIDADSLLYKIMLDDFYEDIAGDAEYKFDTNDYSKDHIAIATGFKVGCNNKAVRVLNGKCAVK